MTQQTVLVINSGSSSIKYKLVEPATGLALANGVVEKIGEPTSIFQHTHGSETVTSNEPIPDHAAGLARVIDTCNAVGPNLRESGIVAVGHRVVQGGAFFHRAAVVDDSVLARIAELIPLAPLHNAAALKGIEVARDLLPDVPHVTVFDTAFFQRLPERSARYALDREIADKYSIRRYGAHGTSHQYVSQRVAEILGREDLKQIILHLGNGASVSAVVSGRPMDTSMGLTPLEGLVMGTRTGDIDPAVVFHLSRVAGMSIDQIDTLFNKQSGLKGLAGVNDMREVRDRSCVANRNAREALGIYIHRVKKYIGAYAAVMGGLDAITFTAGIGENDWVLRAEILNGLQFLGVEVDFERNDGRGGPKIISPDGAKVTALVVPTNEELEIARQAVEII